MLAAHQLAPALVPDMTWQVDMVLDGTVVEHHEFAVALVARDRTQTCLNHRRCSLDALRPILPDRTGATGWRAGGAPEGMIDRDAAGVPFSPARKDHAGLCRGATQPPGQGRRRGDPAQRCKMRQSQQISKRRRFVEPRRHRPTVSILGHDGSQSTVISMTRGSPVARARFSAPARASTSAIRSAPMP